jgi:GT2 family glycosyltransferase
MIDLKNRIGVEILTRNRPEYIYGLLVSLRNQTIDNWDLIIIDNSDVPIESYKYIHDLIVRIRHEGHRIVIHLNENQEMKKNIGASRNLAIEKDDLEYLCRIDDDSILDIDYLERLYNIIKKDEKIGAVGGLVPYFGSSKIYKRLPEIFNKIWKDENGVWQFEDDGHFSYEEKEIRKSHHLRSSFMFRRSAAIKAGLHPVEYGSTGFREETDFSVRIIEAGYDLYTDPHARCWHCVAIGKYREDNQQEQMLKQQYNEIIFRKKITPILDKLKEGGVL